MKTYSFRWDKIDVCMDCPFEEYGECFLLMEAVDIATRYEDCPLTESEVEE